MGKKDRKPPAEPTETAPASFFGSSTTLDPALSSLFTSSSGPIKVPEKPTIAASSTKRQQLASTDLPTPETTTSEAEEDSDRASSESPQSNQELESERPKKRRRVQEDELEDVYFRKLADAEQRDLKQRQEQQVREDNGEVSDSASNDLEDLSDDEDVAAKAIPVHESLSGTQDQDLVDKTNRTIFLSNVSTSAIKEKAAKKTLLTHLESGLPKGSAAKVESIRFRSTPYASGVGPKRAAFATKALLDETAASTHAYVVISTEAAAKAMTPKLNGTVVLERHLHVDHLGAPSPIDHRRCVFIGNLPFVDEETLETNDDENPRKRPKAKLRADPEEGLWQTFGKVGQVENVRMVRDKVTRIGKGFAYVQFSDENAVEAALLMNEKKFPPLLPRKLRVMRSKRPATKPKQLPARGRPDDRKGRGKAVQKTRDRDGQRPKRFGHDKPKNVIFEGHRASKSSDKDRAVKTKSKKKTKKPVTRSANRGAAFRAGGGKKKRDMK